MSEPTPISRADFAVDPDQYTREALAPLVDHPDLGAETADDFYIGHIAFAMVRLGRVALINEDAPAYHEWVSTAETYVDGLQLRSMQLVHEQYYDHLAGMHFYGALHGDAEAASKLDALLDANTKGYAFAGVLSACAEEGISPHTWIAKAKPDDPNGRAQAWSNYIFTRRRAAAEKGETVSREELLASGAWHAVDDFLAGELSAATAFSVVPTIYEFARTPADKNNVIDRFSLLLQEEIDPKRYRYLFDFATRVNADPDIAPEKKRDLTDEVDRAVPAEATNGSTVDYLTHGTFELSQEIADGALPADMLRFAEVLSRSDDHPARRAQLYDGLIKNATDMYTAQNEFGRAAAMLANINHTRLWIEALQKYRQQGGDINLALSSDEMRRIMGDEGADGRKSAQWETRREVADYLRHMENQDYAEAEQVIIAMSQKIGSNGPDALPGYTFPGFLQRLLAEHPDSASIGMQVANNIQGGTFGYHRQVREMFIARGNQEVKSVQWADIQKGGVGDRAMYFGHYASLMLVATQARL